MYNTIEVIFLDIKNAEIKFFKKDGFVSARNDNLQHIKVLPYLSIVQSVEGSYDIALGRGDMQQTGDGGFFIAPAHIQQTIVHHVDPRSKRMRARWLFLSASSLPPITSHSSASAQSASISARSLMKFLCTMSGSPRQKLQYFLL